MYFVLIEKITKMHINIVRLFLAFSDKLYFK